MKWGIEHLRVTLRDDSGETVVIEQSKDGAIRCEQANGVARKAAAEPAANHHEADTASTAAARAKEEPEPRAKSPRRAQARKNKPKTAREPRSEATPEKPEAAPARPASLQWAPTRDGNAWGILARSGGGQFKILRDATSLWSLYYERLDMEGNQAANAKLLGCFPIDAEHKARARAQEHHDNGTQIVATEPVYELCPAPAPGSAEASRTRRVRSPKAPVEAETAAPGAAAEPAVDPAMDAAIWSGFQDVLDNAMAKVNKS